MSDISLKVFSVVIRTTEFIFFQKSLTVSRKTGLKFLRFSLISGEYRVREAFSYENCIFRLFFFKFFSAI